MPEYLAPGVYVEEVSFRSKSIEGVATTTTGFIGPAAYGPVNLPLEIITSLEEFERSYGSGQRLNFTDASGSNGFTMDNYLWHALRAFYAEGGKRAYTVRVFLARNDSDGHARGSFPEGAAEAALIRVKARFPGTAGNVRVRFTLRMGSNILGQAREPGVSGSLRPTLGALLDRDVVWVGDSESPFGSPVGAGDFYLARRILDPTTTNYVWAFQNGLDGSANLTLNDLNLSAGHRVQPVSLTITVFSEEGVTGEPWAVALSPGHVRGGTPDSLFDYFEEEPANSAMALALPIVIAGGNAIGSGIDVLRALFNANPSLRTGLFDPEASELERSFDLLLQDGNDGQRPGAAEYEGRVDPATNAKTGLKLLEDQDEISIVAAPGSTYGYEGNYQDDARAIISQLIIHATKMRYRIAVLDSGNGQSIGQVREMRAKLNSKYAAIYYPWIRVLDPITRRQILLPPSGFVTGIYARNDTLRAVYKAPANEVVNLALGFEKQLNRAQQEVLNPEGVNCFRFFEGRGYLLWGARLATDDSEWKYVNLRRYFAYLERSIDLGTQWAVFEPNGPDLWANIRRTVGSFLLNEWTGGALLGEKPEKAYFVKCDRSTMTQNDLDNGRLICLIGVAPLRPAEFVIFRIGQWTGDAQR